MFDVVIVGGGTAGLSAALVLGRARRHVLVCGEGAPRNAPAAHAHGFFTRDGATPSELLQIGRAQLRPYERVHFQEVAVTSVTRLGGREEGVGNVQTISPDEAEQYAQFHGEYFAVTLSDGQVVQTRRLLLATGVVDILPSIPGLADLWGTGVFHCPYCHGWEVQDQPLAILNNGAMGTEQALLISQWSRDLVLCTNGPADLTDDDQRRLHVRGIQLHEGRIARLQGNEGRLECIVFTDGQELARRGLFLGPSQRQRSDLAARLGCTLSSPLAGVEIEIISVEPTGYTGIPGIYAAGDATTLMQQVVIAAAGGAMAAAAINRDLLLEDLQDGQAA